MSFIRKFGTLIKKSNKNITNINLDNGIELYNYSPNFDLISSKKILDGAYSFTDVWFDINKNDTLYGIINAKNNNIVHLYINDKIIVKNTLLKYNSNLFTINFPYIKNINGNTHIFYYLINNSNYHCTLIHHYKRDDKWIKNEIDINNYLILSNFVVIFKDSAPVVFYFKQVNKYEELFVSIFDLNTNTWSSPFQITNSHKTKVYLSIIKCTNDHYHIAFSENNSSRYYCTYINGYINEYKFITSNYETISKTIACTFPNLIEYSNILYIQWIEYSNLYTRLSYDFGKTWLQPSIDELASNNPFICYNYKSNYSDDKANNPFAIFACKSSLKILGLNNKYIN